MSQLFSETMVEVCLACERTGSVDVVGRTRAAVLGTTVKFCQCADTDVLAEVDVASNGG
jgi:hypothetical protein